MPCAKAIVDLGVTAIIERIERSQFSVNALIFEALAANQDKRYANGELKGIAMPKFSDLERAIESLQAKL